jgi:dethiobiotin synthetase
MSYSTTKATRPGLTAGGFFITGTDTDVGKTYVAGCIAHTLIQAGYKIIPRKPIASGCIKQADNSLLSEDAEFLQQACQSAESLETICPYQFEPAVSPQTAIEQAGLEITIEDLISAIKLPKTVNEKQLYLVEGAGGFYSPICSNGLNKDLAQAVGLPVILVVKNQLGCINSTLLSLAAIEQAGLQTHAIILNFASNTNHAKGIENWTSVPILELSFSDSRSLQTMSKFQL